jgi:Lrp/AsnC family leucine-responsive transcriptional regulator
MDRKDEKIIEILKSDSSLTTRQISKKTNIPITTVHKRIKKLKENNTIKKFTIEIDNKQIGKNISAYVLISADLKILKQKNKTQQDIKKELEKIYCTEKASIVTGESDIIMFVRVSDIEELNKVILSKIQLIDGISDTKTFVVMQE